MPEQAIDASVAIKWVIKGEPLRKKARQLAHDAQSNGITLIAPPIFVYEVESTLQLRLHTGKMTLAATDAALALFYKIGFQIHTHPDMVKRAREIARQYGQERIYDSLYAALAELHSCEFWTADKTFYDAVKATLRYVKYLADYP